MQKRLFISGIGTDIGKTLVSAIFAEALQADYWKPVQAGDLDHTDTMKVRSWLSNTRSVCHEEAYKLTKPMSPHAAAEADGININFADLKVPDSASLVVEGAGGLMVPLNKEQLVIDLIQHLNIPLVLVSRNYLGSINHTLLSVEIARSRGIKIEGMVFNGKRNAASEEYILNYTGLKCLLRIDEEDEINKETIKKYSTQLISNQ